MDLFDRLFPPALRLNLSAAEGASDGGGGGAGGGHYVPAGTTWSQILDYAAGGGDLWPLDLYRVGLPISRDVAVGYATLHRCVTLICGTLAQLLTHPGSLRVVDRAGDRRDTARGRRAVERLTESPDDVEPARNWLEDAIADYCLDGNALVVPRVGTDGRLLRLERMSPWDNDVLRSRDGDRVYRLTAIDDYPRTEYVHARDVAHVRWPRLLRYGRTRSTREGFAQAPVIALRPALDIGIRGDQYIREWFRQGAKSRLHVDFPPPEGAQPLTSEQRRELRDWVREYTQTREPLVTFGGKSSTISDTPQDREAGNLRVFQVREIARVFGIPPPLMGEMVTEWGRGIEELAKLFYRFSASHHLGRFLEPFGWRLLPRGHRFEVDVTELLRGDATATRDLLVALQGDAQRPAIGTRRELRRIAGLPREDDAADAAAAQ